MKLLRTCLIYVSVTIPMVSGQQAPTQTAQQRITGSITAVDPNSHVVTVKEDKTGTDYQVELADTKSLRKVDPVTLDLKKATRITAGDLQTGDRVQVFASKAEDDPTRLAARAIILISARELQSAHQQEAAAWQHATHGVVTQVEGDGKFTLSERTLAGTKTLTVDAVKAEFTRYSRADPKTPAASQLSDLQAGDQVRVLGTVSPDGTSLLAQRVYSSPLRMVGCTVTSVASDGSSITVKDLQTKQTLTVALNADSAIRKLPPELAAALARRLNPPAGGAVAAREGISGGPAGSNQANSAGADGKATASGSRSESGGMPAVSGSGGGGGAMRPSGGMRSGDMSQMLERAPKISATDLKPGDALMVAGIPAKDDSSHFVATNVIAGVEPIFQSASPRQMQSLGDWGLGESAGGSEGAPQ